MIFALVLTLIGAFGVLVGYVAHEIHKPDIREPRDRTKGDDA